MTSIRSFCRRTLCTIGILAVANVRQAAAHPGHEHDDGARAPAVPAHLRATIAQLNTGEFEIVRAPTAVSAEEEESVDAVCDGENAVSASDAAPEIHEHFTPFADSLKLRWDDRYYYVGSNGMPDHPMMIGITAWQQQVPLPQKYFDDNAWRIPLHPVPAKEPAMIKGRFLRGAIALAVNGIPIFNPQNNRGDVSYEIGELDEWGGHCGRADDYHYHIVPVHLEKRVGKDKPVAYALDGFPIYGYQDEKSPDFAPLDRLSGHKDVDGNYHYHATKSYPYVIGGFYGEVVEREEQVDPQPRAQPIREYLQALRGARITEFRTTDPGKYELKYEIEGRPGYVRYVIADGGSVAFTFVDVNGRTTNETYEPGRRRPGGAGGDRRPPPPNQNRPPRPAETAPPRDDRRGPPQQRANDVPDQPSTLIVTSSAIGPDGMLPKEFTCDGAGISPPVAWSGAPAGTKSFAVSLWHTAPDREKSYWLVYDIPADVARLEKNSRDVGRLGQNDKGRSGYDPMCSKGPGLKSYHITVYALSAVPDFSNAEPTRAGLLSAIRNTTLAVGTFTYQYQRSADE